MDLTHPVLPSRPPPRPPPESAPTGSTHVSPGVRCAQRMEWTIPVSLANSTSPDRQRGKAQQSAALEQDQDVDVVVFKTAYLGSHGSQLHLRDSQVELLGTDFFLGVVGLVEQIRLQHPAVKISL